MNAIANPMPFTVDTDILRPALEELLNQRIDSLTRQPSPYQSSFSLEALDVRLADGIDLALLFKNLSWEALPPEVRHAKPAFLYDPLREIDVYRSLLAPDGFGTAHFY